MDLSACGFEFGGKTVTAGSYGSNYIPEFCRVINAYNKVNPGYILEWGSGLTTQILAGYAEIWASKFMLSMDENGVYQKAIFANRPLPRLLTLKTIDRVGPCRSQADPELNYSTFPLSFGHKFDLIFIDGRRRMECAFVAALICNVDATIIIHDYRRTRYQPIIALFDVLEDGSQFRVLRPRRDVHAAFSITSAKLIQSLLASSEV
jgi:hypothetical protein